MTILDYYCAFMTRIHYPLPEEEVAKVLTGWGVEHEAAWKGLSYMPRAAKRSVRRALLARHLQLSCQNVTLVEEPPSKWRTLSREVLASVIITIEMIGLCLGIVLMLALCTMLWWRPIAFGKEAPLSTEQAACQALITEAETSPTCRAAPPLPIRDTIVPTH